MTRSLLFLFGFSSLWLHAELVAHWRFDETSGSTAFDEFGIHDAIWVPGVDATPNWHADGLLGGAIDFPGTGNHLNHFSIPSIPSLNGLPDGMTISVWVKPEGQSGYRGILMTRSVNDGDADQNYGLGHENNWIDGRVSGSGIDSSSGSVPVSNDWIHLAWVWDNLNGSQKLFVNGRPSGTTGSPTPNLTISSNGEWRIGDDACCTNRTFNGLMDDLAVWNHPLSDFEIASLYTNGLDGHAAGESPPPPVTNPLNVGVVINEIHYDPEPKTQKIEFIELLNTNDTPVDLSGVTFSDGVDFVFPPNTILDATSYLIITEDAVPRLPEGTHVFQYDGSLSNDGETIALLRPDGSVLDEVNYRAEFPWPISPNGEGSSMQLINATLDNDLGASWRGAAPTPGVANSVFTLDAPPAIRQVDHSPKMPTSGEATTITTKVTDPDSVHSVELLYQIVSPGSYLPAFLPLSSSVLKSSPATPQAPNPAFEDPANWTTIPMSPVDDVYSATIPAQSHRTLVRYRIRVTDTPGNSVRVPYADDPSLNFAYFTYDGVPGYTADLDSVHPDGAGHTYSSDLLTTLPVYHLITDPDDLAQCWAYDSIDRVSSVASRKVFNWRGTMVYDGVVYDHVGYRLRQRNDRYAGQGRRSIRFRFRRGNYFQARDPDGEKYPVKWRSMNTGKMSRFSEGANHGMRELISSRLWNLAGAVAPDFQHVHFRVIDDAAEFTDQYHGDFYGLAMIFEDVDAQFLESRDLPRGNVYKLKDGETNPLELQRYQARDAVSDASDFLNIKNNLGPPDQYTAQLQRDDGVVIYVNGVEVFREAVPAETPTHLTYATQNVNGSSEDLYQAIDIPASYFIDGENTIAISIHQASAVSSDMSFDFILDGTTTVASQSFEWHATWESGELAAFQSTIAPPALATRDGITCRARVRHQDSTGRWSQWSDPLEFTAGVPDLTFFTSSLVITEIMYHPADPSPAEISAGFFDDNDFEFIEIRNVSDFTVSLLDVRFTKGIDFDFANGAITSLAPGEYALVVNNLAAFEMRYGPGLPVAGEWSGNLSNGGERIKLSFGAGEPIIDFDYDDEGLWPTGPDQNQGSLILRNSAAVPDPSLAFNWRASLEAFGNPGTSDSTKFAGGNSNALLTYATGGIPPTITRLPDGNITFQVTINQLTDDLIASIQQSNDLQAWSTSDFTPISRENLGNNLERVTYQTTTPPGEAKVFLRYRVEYH